MVCWSIKSIESELYTIKLNKAPFIGDAIVFLLDLATGKHWVRALLRTIGAIGVDVGFYKLLAFLSLSKILIFSRIYLTLESMS